MVALTTLIVAFASLVTIPLQAVATVPAQFLLNPPGSAAFFETKNRTEIPQSNIPSDCTAQCTQQTLVMLTNCTFSMCMCDDATFGSITGCLDCLVNTPDAERKISQPLRDHLAEEYATTCNLLDHKITGAKVNSASRILGLGNGQIGFVGTVIVAAVLSVVV